MSDLFDLIETIRKRPVMYLGQQSIGQLRTFLAGYCFARRQMGIPETPQEKAFSLFQSWVQQKFGTASHQHWDRTVLSFSEDEADGLARFFLLFDEFVESNQLPEAEPANQPVQKIASLQK